MFWRTSRLRPTEFAVLASIPLTRDEFMEAGFGGSDFVLRYCSEVGGGVERGWLAYAPYAAMCRDMLRAVQGWGVTVLTEVSVQSLAVAARDFEVLTVIAHARGPEIEARDVVDATALQEAYPLIMAALGRPLTKIPARDHLAEALDEAVGPREAEVTVRRDTEGYAWRVACYRERWRKRLAIEAVVPGVINGGPSIELANRLVSIDEVSEQLRTFRTLDLTVCDSVLLAECIRATHKDGVILCNPCPATLDFRAALYREAIRLVARRRQPYAEILIELRRHLRGQAS